MMNASHLSRIIAESDFNAAISQAKQKKKKQAT